VALSNRSWSLWKRGPEAFLGEIEENHETPVRIAIYWIGLETGTSSIWLNSAKNCVSPKFERAVKKASNRKSSNKQIFTFCAGIRQTTSYFCITIRQLFTTCDGTRQLFETCEYTRQISATSVIVPSNDLQHLWQ